MSDDLLSRYLPTIGDRLALRRFAKRNPVKTKSKPNKRSLFQKLKNKMKLHCELASDSEGEDTLSRKKFRADLDGNKHATKKTRIIDMGWMHEGKQVKQKQGGGTRQLTVNKTTNKGALIQLGVDLFFPGGVSKKGTSADMKFSILDFKEVELPENATVGEVYEVAKIGRARFYLSSELINKPSQSTSAVQSPSETANPGMQVPNFDSQALSLDNSSCSQLQSVGSCLQPMHCCQSSASPLIFSGDTCPFSTVEYNTLLYNTLPFHSQVINSDVIQPYHNQLTVPAFISPPSSQSSENSATAQEQPESATVYGIGPVPSTEEPSSNSSSIVLSSDTTVTALTPEQPVSATVHNNTQVSSTEEQTFLSPPISLSSVVTSEQPESATIYNYTQVLSTEDTAILPESRNGSFCQTVTENTTLVSSGNVSVHADVVLASSTNTVHNTELALNSENVDNLIAEPLRLSLHRVNVKEELIGMFKDPSIMTCCIKFSYINEQGIDNLGVSRDVYSSFWIEFFTSNAEGEAARVPALNPKWQAEEWTAIGRILLKGLTDANFYPVQFAPAFSIALIYGENAVTPKNLMDSFLQYLNKTDRDLVELAVAGNITADDDQDDLLDLLDRFGSKSVPNVEGLKPLFLQIAHKELVQKPKYALDKMSSETREKLSLFFPDPSSIEQMYKEKVPTVKKILKLITAVPENNDEAKALKYFQQYVKAQESSTSLKKLLRFLTGSDAITVDKISLTFTNIEGFTRRPIAHTCGPVLELPSTYQSYPELRSDFDNILSSRECMEMTIA